jgi:3-oxoadipate enol-lactonase
VIAVPGGELAWSEDGEGPAAVLVHAGLGDQRMWEDLVPLLSADRRVIRYDMRGFGHSRTEAGAFAPERDLLALIDALELSDVQLVGASFGGLVALAAAATAPERFRALVLLAPLAPEFEASAELSEYWEAEEAAIDDGRIDDAVELNLRMWVDRSSDDPAIRALVAEMQRHAYELQLETDAEPEFAEKWELSAITPPAMVVVGSADVPDFIGMARGLVDALPHATLHEITGAGHLLALERPREVAALMLR